MTNDQPRYAVPSSVRQVGNRLNLLDVDLAPGDALVTTNPVFSLNMSETVSVPFYAYRHAGVYGAVLPSNSPVLPNSRVVVIDMGGYVGQAWQGNTYDTDPSTLQGSGIDKEFICSKNGVLSILSRMPLGAWDEDGDGFGPDSHFVSPFWGVDEVGYYDPYLNCVWGSDVDMLGQPSIPFPVGTTTQDLTSDGSYTSDGTVVTPNPEGGSTVTPYIRPESAANPRPASMVGFGLVQTTLFGYSGRYAPDTGLASIKVTARNNVRSIVTTLEMEQNGSWNSVSGRTMSTSGVAATDLLGTIADLITQPSALYYTFPAADDAVVVPTGGCRLRWKVELYDSVSATADHAIGSAYTNIMVIADEVGDEPTNIFDIPSDILSFLGFDISTFGSDIIAKIKAEWTECLSDIKTWLSKLLDPSSWLNGTFASVAAKLVVALVLLALGIIGLNLVVGLI